MQHCEGEQPRISYSCLVRGYLEDRPGGPREDSLAGGARPHLPLSPLPWDCGDPREEPANEMDKGLEGLLLRGKGERPRVWSQGYLAPGETRQAHAPPWWLRLGTERQAGARPSVMEASACNKAGAYKGSWTQQGGAGVLRQPQCSPVLPGW